MIVGDNTYRDRIINNGKGRVEVSLQNRREFLLATPIMVAAGPQFAKTTRREPEIGFGFGTYGMKTLSIPDSIRTAADIGYDGLEFALMKGWPTEPVLLTAQDRRNVQKMISDRGLEVPSLLESLPCLRGPEKHRENLEKLKQAIQLAQEIGNTRIPVVQSIVGGAAGNWDRDRDRAVDELGDWARIAAETRTTVCFKPHASNLVNTPERALWIHQRIGSSWLKTVYDFSHFSLEGLSLKESLEKQLPITSYVQIKDSKGTPGKHEYLLPGDGTTDYLQLLRILRQNNYNGFVNVEISSMIHRRKDYQPVPTARLCYARLEPIFEKAGVRRPQR